MLSLEQVKMLVLSAELGSFSACARRMGKVQSAVSHGISSLEIDLGVELFDRTSRSPKLTAAGERLLRSAKTLLSQSDELERIADAIQRKEEGVLTIAIDDGLFIPEMSNLLPQLANKFPFLQLDLLTLASTDISHEVANGDVDLGIMFSEIEELKQVDFCYVGSVDYIAVCHPDFALASHPVISASDLVPYRQVAIRGRLKQESQSLISMSPKVWWCSSHHSALQLVQQKVGWAYLPEFLVETLIASGELHHLQVAFDYKPWSVPIDLVFKKGGPHGPAYQWLFDEIKAMYAKQ